MSTPPVTPTPMATPRADEAEVKIGYFHQRLVVPADFARTLERELSATTQRAEELAGALEETLRMYCLVQKCELGHPCPENISTLQDQYAALARYHATRNDEGK